MNRWVQLLPRLEFIYTNGSYAKDARQIRRAISELRKVGVIFIPTGKHYYTKMNPELASDRELIENFVRTQTSHLATQYFNTVKPLKDYSKDGMLLEMLGELLDRKGD